MKELLWDAVWREDIEEVKRLLEPGFVFTLQANNGNTLLMQAAELKNIKITEFLISKGADSYYGATPVHVAVVISLMVLFKVVVSRDTSQLSLF